MTPDSSLDVRIRPSPNHGARDGRLCIDTLVLHYTGMEDAGGALEWLCSPESNVSAHYFVYEDGNVVQMVPEERRAWHAGAACWAGERDINGCSIGIEIANGGPDSAAPEFPRQQMEAVIELCGDIIARHSIAPGRVLGHSDVAPGRKIDPGLYFDWQMLHESGIGLWVEPEKITGGDRLKPGDEGRAVEEFQRQLAAYGYAQRVRGFYCADTAIVVAAFQLHFRPALIDGVGDVSTQKTLRKLLQNLDL